MTFATQNDTYRNPDPADVFGPYSRWPRREPTSHRNPATLGGAVAAATLYVR